jgi:hypothetical protein
MYCEERNVAIIVDWQCKSGTCLYDVILAFFFSFLFMWYQNRSLQVWFLPTLLQCHLNAVEFFMFLSLFLQHMQAFSWVSKYITFFYKLLRIIRLTDVYFQGDLRKHLNNKGALEPSYAVKLALDIARFATHPITHMTLLLLFFCYHL